MRLSNSGRNRQGTHKQQGEFHSGELVPLISRLFNENGTDTRCETVLHVQNGPAAAGQSVYMKVALLAGLCLVPTIAPAQTFDQSVKPLLVQKCRGCHNDQLSSGGLSVTNFLDPASITTKREGWELILDKLRAGEMPPPSVTKPAPEKVEALVTYIQGEFDKVDKTTKPDPGRIVAHRLNRNEYSNTIRDLLGVPFHAEEEFPADDASFGFDNIGAALTVSPTLMQKYLQSAEQIASRAVGGDPLPKPGLFDKRNRIKRLDADTIEFKDRIDFDADYTFRALLVGHRGETDKPLTLVLSIDGKPMKTLEVPVQISAVNKQGGSHPALERRNPDLHLPGRTHLPSRLHQ